MRSATVDYLLTGDARRTLEALVLLGGARGYLLGHRRGARIIVEALVPAAPGRPLSGNGLRALEKVFGRPPVGFFSAGRGLAAAASETRRPFGYGKLHLEARSRGGRSPEVRAFIVEFDGAFRHVPVPPAPEPARREQ